MDQAMGPGNDQSGAALASRIHMRLELVGGLSNGIGALIVFSLLPFVAPRTIPSDQFRPLLVRGAVAFCVYMGVTLPLGRYWAQVRPWAPLRLWLHDERPATDAEQMLVLRYPLTWAVRTAPFWAVAAIVFSLITLTAQAGAAVAVAVTTVLGGVTAVALQYLLVERVLRPVTAKALAGGPPPRLAAPGVAGRLSMTWALATGVPLLLGVMLAVVGLVGAGLDDRQVVAAMLALAALALAVGLLATLLAARSVAGPVVAVRRAVERIEGGDLQARVAVDDGSEIGLLQAGFNRMVAGLRERELLREAFGTFVDPSLTQRVLTEGTDLAGEEVEVSIMFIDVRGFTAFAEGAEASQIVARLNTLYGLVVPIILRCGGHANTFIGDGLLAVFGAPERFVDHPDRAVAAALEIAHTVRNRYGEDLRIGIGVNSGRVVAGTIGGGGRLTFTVIGDAVNTAARVEAATRVTGDDILITEATRRLLRHDLGRWTERPATPLKGKAERVALYAPCAPDCERREL